MPELSSNLSLETVAVRLGVACLLAALIGLEREWHRKPAGMRTHMLVGIGAATFFLIFIEFALGPLKDIEGLSPDPTRIFQGVITGIGFLGAGAIIQGGGDVRGLTTGAGIWIAGAVGLAAGGGYFLIAGTLTVFTLLILVGAGILERCFIEPAAEEVNGDDD